MLYRQKIFIIKHIDTVTNTSRLKRKCDREFRLLCTDAINYYLSLTSTDREKKEKKSI